MSVRDYLAGFASGFNTRTLAEVGLFMFSTAGWILTMGFLMIVVVTYLEGTAAGMATQRQFYWTVFVLAGLSLAFFSLSFRFVANREGFDV